MQGKYVLLATNWVRSHGHEAMYCACAFMSQCSSIGLDGLPKVFLSTCLPSQAITSNMNNDRLDRSKVFGASSYTEHKVIHDIRKLLITAYTTYTVLKQVF